MQYNQWKAMLAISKASLTSIFRSPSAVIFSFLFPIIFILVFGFLSSSSPVIKIVFDPASSNNNDLYKSIIEKKNLKIIVATREKALDELSKGHITAIVKINELPQQQLPRYSIELISSSAAADKIGLLQSVVQQSIAELNKQHVPNQETYALVTKQTIPGRIYRTIDFILPGQLGFSLLSAGVFGVAFIFFNLRQALVLKRFFATPIKRTYIVLGEGLGRIVFQMITAVVILLFGHFAFNFTLVNGWITFIELIALSLVGLIIFMGFGFVVSGVAKSESTIPPFANIVTLPQFLLAGTFFPVENFPSWLQPLCNLLPLTHLNQAMRNVAFEGAHLYDCIPQLQVLLIWGIVVYAIAIKVFKWE
jgi:ABC-2 type transport system permease protein